MTDKEMTMLKASVEFLFMTRSWGSTVMYPPYVDTFAEKSRCCSDCIEVIDPQIRAAHSHVFLHIVDKYGLKIKEIYEFESKFGARIHEIVLKLPIQFVVSPRDIELCPGVEGTPTWYKVPVVVYAEVH